MNKKTGYWWVLHRNSTEEEIVYVGKEEDFLSPDYKFLRPVAKYHELTPETYQEGVLATESTDMNAIMMRLSYIKIARLLHAAMGKVTEAAEFMDQLKKHIYYGKELDEVNLIEEIGDGNWYDSVAMDVLGTNQHEVWQRNRDKLLKKRYKNGFTKEAALNRDLEAEREALENQLDKHFPNLQEDLDRITIGGDVKKFEIHACAKGTSPCDGNCKPNNLVNEIVDYILAVGPVSPRGLEAQHKNFKVSAKEMRIAIQQAIEIDGVLEIDDSCKVNVSPPPISAKEYNRTFDISDEELEYQMRPSLEADIHYMEEDNE